MDATKGNDKERVVLLFEGTPYDQQTALLKTNLKKTCIPPCEWNTMVARVTIRSMKQPILSLPNFEDRKVSANAMVNALVVYH